MGRYKNIGMVLESPFPPDIRVEKEAEALADFGHHVFILCPRRKGEPKTGPFHKVTVNRINLSTNRYAKAFWDVINSVFFSHPVFYRSLKKFSKENKIDVFHVHDLPLSGSVIKYGKRNKIPVVVDLHENYPEATRAWFKWKKNPIVKLKNQLFFSYKRWFKYEKTAVENGDRIIAVVDEMKSRLLTDHHLDPHKIVVVSNTEKKDFLNQELDNEAYGNYADKFIITYTGSVGPHRGIDTVIDGMQYLKDHPDIHFFLIGRVNPGVKNKLMSMIRLRDVADQVHMLGYQPFEKIYSYMKMASLNVIPHHSNGHTDNTIPHKLFQSMMTSNAVLVSSSAPLKRIVTETNCGLIFEAGNPEDFARKVSDAYKNQEMLHELGKNGYDHTMNKSLNWEHTSKSLIDLYSKITPLK